MATLLRAELSEKNPYYIPKERYFELKHFCLQYRSWKEELNRMNGYAGYSHMERAQKGLVSDPTLHTVERRERLSGWIEIVEEASSLSDKYLQVSILRGVTEGLSYEQLRARYSVPCGKDLYYEAYRKFFWVLDQLRE